MSKAVPEKKRSDLEKMTDLLNVWIGCYFRDKEAIQRETLGEYLTMALTDLRPDYFVDLIK